MQLLGIDNVLDAKKIVPEGALLQTAIGITYEISDPWGNIIGFADYSKDQKFLEKKGIEVKSMGKETRKIEVAAYGSLWPELFELEATHIQETLGENCINIHHVGKLWFTLGGSIEEDQRASKDSWSKLIAFFGSALKLGKKNEV